MILVFTPLLVVHSIPAAPKDAEGAELTASKAWLFIGEQSTCCLTAGSLEALPAIVSFTIASYCHT
jgi:hypothetical protein